MIWDRILAIVSIVSIYFRECLSIFYEIGIGEPTRVFLISLASVALLAYILYWDYDKTVHNYYKSQALFIHLKKTLKKLQEFKENTMNIGTSPSVITRTS